MFDICTICKVLDCDLDLHLKAYFRNPDSRLSHSKLRATWPPGWASRRIRASQLQK